MTGDDEIVIQGDVKDDLFEVIPDKWPQVSYKRKKKKKDINRKSFLMENCFSTPQIDEDSIDDLGDQKR